MKFRIVRLNQLTLDPGAYVLVGTRQMRDRSHQTFPAQLEVSSDGVIWEAVEFVNASLVDDEDTPPK
jgi:hypothetical protein